MQVKKAAYTAMSACFKLQGNRDIEPCVPLMLSCIARPAEANNAIVKLSATTFVQVRAARVSRTAIDQTRPSVLGFWRLLELTDGEEELSSARALWLGMLSHPLPCLP